MSHEPSIPQQPEEGTVPAETVRYLQWLFAYDRLTVKQKLITLSEKYYVEDGQGNPRFYVVRPPRITLNMIAGMSSMLIVILGLYLAYRQFFDSGNLSAAAFFVISSQFLAGIVRLLIAPYRDITVYTDDTEQFPVLYITQDNKIGLYNWFTIYDALGQPIARARRNTLYSIIRKDWMLLSLWEEPLCRVREDSWFLSLLRRYLGSLYGLLLTNFDFILPNGQRVGEYNRKYTITDQYVLNLGEDKDFLLDRRVALAIAILLDTAERR